MFSCSFDFGKYTLLDAGDGRVLAVLADKQYTAAVPADAAGACPLASGLEMLPSLSAWDAGGEALQCGGTVRCG